MINDFIYSVECEEDGATPNFSLFRSQSDISHGLHLDDSLFVVPPEPDEPFDRYQNGLELGSLEQPASPGPKREPEESKVSAEESAPRSDDVGVVTVSAEEKETAIPLEEGVGTRGRPGRKRQFTPEDDQQLINLVKTYGEAKWAIIARLMPGRNRKQLRDHYVNLLKRQSCTREFTPTEDSLILQLIKTEGRSWNKISTRLPGRSPAAIKNRYYSRLKRLLKCPRSRSYSVNGSESDARTPGESSSLLSESTEGGPNRGKDTIVKIKLPEKVLQRVLDAASKRMESVINPEVEHNN